MNPSVSPEGDWELTKDAVYYAREGGAELGLAFITEFERALALLCTHPELGAPWRNRRRASLSESFLSVSSTQSEAQENIRDAIREYLAVVEEQLKGEDVREVEIAV